MGSVAVEVHWVVIDRGAIFARCATGHTGHEVVSDDIIDVAIAFIVDSVAGNLERIDPDVAVCGIVGGARRICAAQVAMGVLDARVHRNDDNSGVTILHGPGKLGIDPLGIPQVPLRPVECGWGVLVVQIVGRLRCTCGAICEERMNADFLDMIHGRVRSEGGSSHVQVLP